MRTEINTIIIGGTFNPIHIGHMHLADEVYNFFHPERVLIVPAYIAAHKKGEVIVGPEQRLKMIKIALRGSNFEIETCELERQGISYSIDTIRYIKEKYKLKSPPGLLIGDDLAEGFDGWKDASMIAEEARLIVAYRDFNKLSFGYEHQRINNLILNISSSEIRQRIREGRACKYLMPDGVYDYIIANNLYGE